MTIVVTGATGQLGSRVVEHLLQRVPAQRVVASVRVPRRAGHLGVEVRHGDFNRPETLRSAFAGADEVLIISTSTTDSGAKARQHVVALRAAEAAGVGRIVYTSLTAAGTSRFPLARAHRETELALTSSDIPCTILRNNWYFENDLGVIAQALATGVIATSSRGGRFAPAARDDFARAAAAVLTTDGHENAVYELGAPVSYSYQDWAEEISRAAGRTIRYVELDDEEAAAGLRGAQLPDALVTFLLAYYQALARGELDVPSDALSKLIGEEPASLRDLVSVAVGSRA